MKLFTPGKRVVATTTITRRDGKASIGPGQWAIVISCSLCANQESQIVRVQLQNGYQIGDIVVTNGIPLKEEM